MIAISYSFLTIAVSIVWILLRAIICMKNKKINWKRELQLLLVYICIVVVMRFTFFPFSKVNGAVQPLLLDLSKIYPFRLNFVPFVHLFEYPIFKEALLNFIGNTTMFIPIGIIWPIVFKKLDKPVKVIAAGVGFSLCIEIFQLPFYDRVTDIDDLILNSAGFLIGYGVYLAVKWIRNGVETSGKERN